LLLSVLLVAACRAAAPAREVNVTNANDRAMFAAGCFWGVQSAFDRVKGVAKTTVGYTGGRTDRPTYRDVCTDTTGHAEAILVEFDSSVVSYRELLARFFELHDPTTPNRQGPDVGSQYRSAVFYFTPEQQAQALGAIAELSKSGRLARPVVTEVVPAGTFWPAEEYHQKYHQKHGGACGVN
jgi:peptide-methionine (S)-S-oxide reductase